MQKIVKNQLGYEPNLFIYQDKDMFNYSVDTILLGNFATIDKNNRHILEVGTNNGALAIFLAARSKKIMIDAIEIQNEAVELALKNVEMNNLSKQISVFREDFNHYWRNQNKQQAKKYDSVICNPPFYKLDKGKMRKGDERIHIATHEIKLTLEQLILGASKLLRQKGNLALVLPTERLVDLFELLRKHKFEPKRVQFIHPRETEKSNLVLVEARFQTGWGTVFLPNIYLHPEDKKNHVYRDEVIAQYYPKKEEEK